MSADPEKLGTPAANPVSAFANFTVIGVLEVIAVNKSDILSPAVDEKVSSESLDKDQPI